ncbi:hypothetical protein BSKO_14000 [Bryopsis sp. KO-2023]|nr:hypothetical protein BSKO_14000 [Bryopsis sp. KO-2023]
MSGYDLPSRASRGKRLQRVVGEELDADEDFWGQEFFKEETKDECYETESQSEDIPDSDFDDPEDDFDDEEGEVEPKEAPKRKRLLPPGTKPKPRKAARTQRETRSKTKKDAKKEVRKLKAATSDQERVQDSEGEKEKEEENENEAAENEEEENSNNKTAAAPAPPVLRNSTIKRREQAELERERQEKIRSKRKRTETTHKYKPLTQAEMLKEAAQTEIKNLESLQQLVEMEEESKKKALERKTKYVGPLLRIKSSKVDGSEKTTMEMCHMQKIPRRFLPKKAPPPVTRSFCAVTGLPALYRDPLTGLPYANADAFKEVRRRSIVGRRVF